MYIILIEDRHSDPEVMLYKDKEKAINEARTQAKQYCKHEDDYEEHDYSPTYLFYATYSCESDSVSVIEANIEDEK